MKTPRQEILHLVICLNCLKNGNTEQDCTVEGSNITCTQCKKNQGVFNHNLNQVSFLQSRAEDRLEEKVEKEKFLPKNWSRWRNQNADFSKDLSSDSGLIVDIGCGPGVFHPIFEGATIIGVDFMSYENVNIVTDLEEELPLKGECASICLMTNFLEHSYKPIVALKSAWRILKPGGRVIITVPFLMSVHQAPYDYHRYTPFFFLRALEECGFQINRFDVADDFSTFLSLTERFYRYHIHNGELIAKVMWQISKMQNALLERFLPRAQIAEYSIGYMIEATKV